MTGAAGSADSAKETQQPRAGGVASHARRSGDYKLISSDRNPVVALEPAPPLHVVVLIERLGGSWGLLGHAHAGVQ